MALYKTCSRCGKTIAAEEKMCQDCWAKNRKAIRHRHNRYSYTRDKEDIAFYNSNVWKKVSNEVRRKFFNCCAICFCNSQKLHKDLKEISNLNYFNEDGKRKNLIHHIIEYKQDNSLATNESNLICVCEKHHSLIHKLYENGRRDKLQRELLELVARWKDFI